MYKFTGIHPEGQHAVEPLPGVPLEAEDEVFLAELDKYEQLNGAGSKQGVLDSGLYEHTPDAPVATAAAVRRRREDDDDERAPKKE